MVRNMSDRCMPSKMLKRRLLCQSFDNAVSLNLVVSVAEVVFHTAKVLSGLEQHSDGKDKLAATPN